MTNNAQWSSRIGFILASAGSAIGLGAIWKFPFWAGANGGAGFIIPYIIFTFTIGVALVMAEVAIWLGRFCYAPRGWSLVRCLGCFGCIDFVLHFVLLLRGGWLVCCLSLGRYFGQYHDQ